jgi:hypothetical protein
MVVPYYWWRVVTEMTVPDRRANRTCHPETPARVGVFLPRATWLRATSRGKTMEKLHQHHPGAHLRRASSNWAGSPVQGDDDDQSVEDATYAPSGGAPATCGVATRGAAALDGKMRSLASEGDGGSGAAGNFSRPSGARSRRGVALPSSSEEALKGYDGGRSLGIAGDDKIPSRTRPRRGVPLPSDSEEALKGYDGDPGAAYHSTVPSGARSRRGVALPSDSGEALKGYDGGGMSGSRGSNKPFSGSATDISTAGGHSRRCSGNWGL